MLSHRFLEGMRMARNVVERIFPDGLLVPITEKGSVLDPYFYR